MLFKATDSALTLHRSLVLVTAGMLAALLPLLASAQLSPRYEDSDADLVADRPADPESWRDPRILVFAYTPVEDPALYSQVWDEFITHMETLTGKEIRFFPVQSNAAQLEAMRAGRLHVAGFNTGSTPVAVNCTGFVPFAMMAAQDGSFGYEMEIITYPDSGINNAADLQGRQLAFTSPTSNSGFKAPSTLLDREFGLQADRDYTTTYSGSHDNSILGVVNGDYEAAAIANEVLRRMEGRDVVSADQYRSIYRSLTFPTTAYGMAHNLAPELAEKIRQAFFSFDWEGSALQQEFADAGMAQFIPISYKQHWQVIRDIDEANDTIYNCD
ncbi:MAG: phosphonate ABC transporter substrate-binding protein [Gammaproteobacteria bacterium]|nr:phosphonate ABC transporter substrate-binding protein [Gammaproteobacteria bacterium]MBJ54580.1 phosphonate ABC transporter substrate-binding protein [Gammaproteobacteria bacterium]HBN15768.1 phosphate/phosphite/phosphonate ABC transporter substrate-binding protein [Pseudohongiella sp.]|tara:strand:+ start:1601 stop:2584 length:984 start_codon:yes stop_codon:yes gene_type:complete